ncbi:MAG TPA: hypothetical protein VD994_00750 [Prosthecobacter sp.]|nr:hypothetical protein [Prosthecobacter sp.]
MSLEVFTEPGSMFQIGLPPNRVDFLTSITGLDFSQCWEQRTHVVLADTQVPFISLRDLIEAKRLAGRDQDLLDVKALEKVLS